MPLTERALQQLAPDILDRFSYDALRKILSSIEKDIEDFKGDDRSAKLDDILKTALQEGWISELLVKLKEARPAYPDFGAAIDKALAAHAQKSQDGEGAAVPGRGPESKNGAVQPGRVASVRLSGDQIESLTKLTEQYYDVETLERLVRFKCERDLRTIDAFQNKTSGIYRLFDASEKEGWLLKLVKALADARPQVPEFRELYDEIGQPAAATDITIAPATPSPGPAANPAPPAPPASTVSVRQAGLLGDWYGAQMQGAGPKGAPISYPLRLQIRNIAPDIRGIFRFTFRSQDKSLDETIEFVGQLIQDRFLRIWYCDDKSGKVQLGSLLLELSDDGLELAGFDVGYGYSSGQIATARTMLRKQSILIDPLIDLMQRGAFPPSWATRAAFVNPKAAKYWQTRAITLESEAKIVETYIASLAALDGNWDLMISCGPGDAVVDRKLVAALSGRVKQYVPIDISQGACNTAVHAVAAICPVPVGIVGDLEEGFDFITGALQQVNPGRILLLCTGNLIGNLDVGERTLLENLAGLTRSNDIVLLSFATGAFAEPADRATFDANVVWDDLHDLVACGLENVTGQDWQTVKKDVNNRIAVRVGVSDVPGATTRQLFDNQSGKTVLTMRRYDFAKIVAWIRAAFPFQNIKSVQVATSEAAVQLGIVVLQRI